MKSCILKSSWPSVVLPFQSTKPALVRQKASKNMLAVVLLEIDLSDMDGIDLVKAIRENPDRAQTPIIAMSAFPYGGG